MQGGGSKTCGQREHIKYFDIYRERPVRLTVRALIPVREHPKVRGRVIPKVRVRLFSWV